MAMPEQCSLQAWDELTQQATFRQLLHAFSYPGTIVPVASPLVHVLAALVDGAVALADPHGLLDARMQILLEATLVEPAEAHFIVANGSRTPGFVPRLGTLAAPEQGATIILRVQRLGSGEPLEFRGPGIAGTSTLQVEGLSSIWLRSRDQWNAGFPRGVDLILIDGEQVAALPRTTRVNYARPQGDD